MAITMLADYPEAKAGLAELINDLKYVAEHAAQTVASETKMSVAPQAEAVRPCSSKP